MFNNLIAELARAKITQKQLAESLGLTETTVSRKLKGTTNWKLNEISTILKMFPGSEFDYLFKKGA